ncbi:hypothetical protein BV20DRAFT_1038521 [Pilatotrama ljubarskyi]|nr:hypothetical protein BV20DRAFT_1038521 [Pilatotrama ljubarskyi]
MLYPCLTCLSRFQTSQGLGTHRKKCQGRLSQVVSTLAKRKAARDEVEEARKRARIDQDKLLDTEVRFYPLIILPPPSSPGQRSRSGRKVKLPKRWEDFLPTNKRSLPSQIADALPQAPTPPPLPPASPTPPPTDYISEASPVPEAPTYETPSDGFGVHRVYTTLPLVDPTAHTTLDDISDVPSAPPRDRSLPSSVRWIGNRSQAEEQSPYAPLANESTFLLCEWYNNSSTTKSVEDFDKLVAVINSDGFKKADVKDFKPRRELDHLDAHVKTSGIFSENDGWRQAEVEISLPKAGVCFPSEADAPKYKVKGLQFRKLLEVIVGEVQDRRFAKERNWIPFETYWVPPQPSPAHNAQDMPPPPPPPIRIYSDTFDTDKMNSIDAKIRAKPRNPDDPPDVEYAVLPCCIWSDATCLTTFGSASLWPIYLYVTHISKYLHGKPTEFVAQHLAYIPTLPDELQDFYRQKFDAAPSPETLRWCKCELMQQIWLLLLDPEFMHAYEHGILLECGDGVVRRLFPRLFTYSADYPEKVLLTAIKNLGKCPCPRCLVTKAQIPASGTKPDIALRKNHERLDSDALQYDIRRARDWMFTKGYSPTSAYVQRLLDSRSLTPMQMFTPDLMHEFELGVWKGIFTHLLRLLHAQGKHAVQEFDRRMRNMPTFGRDKIRRFWNNVSRQNKLAARDYEDFLITALPAFEGLLPLQDDQTTADLLFELVNWHALAKLRLHTEVTVEIFRAATNHMYAAVRMFARTTCETHTTHELKKEADARTRRRAADSSRKVAASSERRIVKFNVWNTYKYHCLGDCPDCVVRAGPLETTSTQMGELEHRHVKCLYARTNKIHYAAQIAKQQRRQAIICGIRVQLGRGPPRGTNNQSVTSVPSKQQPHRHREAAARRRCRRRPKDDPMLSGEADFAGPTDPATRYAVGVSENESVNVYDWLAQHDDDPALEVADLVDDLEIRNDRLYRHRVIRFNYTTYDMRRDQDSVNPRTHPDIMLLAADPDSGPCDGASPYIYARVVGIFHVYARYRGPGSTPATRNWQPVELLWVRWFESDTDYPSGFAQRRLPRLRFVDAHDPDTVAFDFVNPAEVLRAAYILPSFSHGLTSRYLDYAGSVGRHETHPDEDYLFYYVGIFVDRDMYMRHLGGGSRQHASRIQRRRKYPQRRPPQPGPSFVAEARSTHLIGTLPSSSETSDAEDEALPWVPAPQSDNSAARPSHHSLELDDNSEGGSEPARDVEGMASDYDQSDIPQTQEQDANDEGAIGGEDEDLDGEFSGEDGSESDNSDNSDGPLDSELDGSDPELDGEGSDSVDLEYEYARL